MTKKILFILVISACFSFYVNRVKKYTPPGTAQISENFFADETEISNFAWQEYESWIKNKYGKDSKEYNSVLPDSLVWRQKVSANEPYVKYYYRHPAYKNFPVVGISHAQAIDYCKWRTARVKESYYKTFKTELKVEYRLPTKQEWEMINNNGAELFTNSGKNKKGEVMFNHRWMTDTESQEYFRKHNQYPDVTTTTTSFSKNKFGLFCSYGNVAEMVSENGISKGGSWLHTLEECRRERDISYTAPTAWLGFRCVCDMKAAS